MSADENLWDSAFDFQRVVLPVVRRWLPPGAFLAVEGEGEQLALKVVDTVADIDTLARLGRHASARYRLPGAVRQGSVRELHHSLAAP